jgi:predicted ribosome quality control (RQC) complex YloA/Tae2 family protein
MRTELTSLDIYFLLKEFRSLIDSRIDKIYQNENNFVISLHSTGRAKAYLNIMLPNFVFISESKEDYEESGNFALSMRKHLSNTRIKKIVQKEFERIIEFEIETKESVLKLIIELFRPGNLILCDENYKIIMASEYKSFGSRLIRPGNIYAYPKKEYNLLELKEKQFVELIEKSEKNSIVIALAVELGLGGMYAEELCSMAKIDKKATKIDKKEAVKLFASIEELKNKKISAHVYAEGSQILDITPFELLRYKDMKSEKKESFNEALAQYLEKALKDNTKKEKLSKYDTEKRKLESIIAKQENQIRGLEEASAENQKKGEMIYEKYSFFGNIISELKKAREKHSFKEIKEKIKGSKTIKEIDEKEHKITVDVE